MPPAERILLGSRVLAPGVRPPCEAVALAAGKVLLVGSRRDALDLRSAATDVVPLPEGSAILPGFIDAHAHLLGLGQQLSQLDLGGTRSQAEAAARAAEAGRRLPCGTWVVGRGWDENDWSDSSSPRRDSLTSALPDRPALLVRVDGHAAWVNDRALQQAGIGPGTADPAGGRIERDAAGRPTGVLVDRAVDLVRSRLPEPTVAEREARLLLAQEACHRVGLTGIHDAGVDEMDLRAYRNLEKAGRLRLRVHAMLDLHRTEIAPYLRSGPRAGAWLTVRSIKVYMDGALGSRGAALLRPYHDDPDNSGLLLEDPQALEALCLRAFAAGFQVSVHAIGDRANRLVLDVFEEALPRSGADPAAVRPRIEHAQVLAPEDVPRFGRLGVVASMQPVHCVSDMDWVGRRLGADRLPGAYAWRSLREAGARLAFGSDFPVEPPGPLEGVHAAVTRCRRDGSPAGGFFPRQCLTVAEALEAFTSQAAWAAFEEGRLGTIAPGAEGDLVVLDRDPTSLQDASQILETRVRMTVAGGEIVHRSV